VDFHDVLAHVKGDVGHVQEVVGEVFLDDIAFVAAADDKVVDSNLGLGLHDTPKNRLPADFDHRFWTDRDFFGDSGTEATGENDCFYF
jgi:hypothetical protein